jgi:hypothetical protein
MSILGSAAAANATGDFGDTQASAHADLVNRAASVKTEIDTASAAHLGILEAQATLAKLNGGEPAPVNRAVSRKTCPTRARASSSPSSTRRATPEAPSTPDEYLNRAAKYIDRALKTTADTAGIIPSRS